MKKIICGGWVLTENMQSDGLPEKLASAWAEVMNLTGAEYLPVLYVGTQLVNGMNHMVVCRQTLITQDNETHLVKVVLNCSLSGKWTVSSIETIV